MEAEINKNTIESTWEKTGLLEGAVNKTSLAQVLEAMASTIFEASKVLEKQQASYMMTTALPVLSRALRTVDFSVEIKEEKVETEAVRVQVVSSDQDLLEECIRCSHSLSELFQKYEKLNISKVKVSNFDNGYHIGLECSSFA